LPRPDVITPDCIMKVLRVSRPEAYKVLREAIRWGVLRLALRKDNKPWWGHYEVNWRAVEYVASLLPMNIEPLGMGGSDGGGLNTLSAGRT